MRKYLEDIGVTPRTISWKRKDEKNWKKQKKIYGFDVRETWDLDHTFYCWLYERVKMYLDYADKYVDLTYHKFEYNDKTFNKKELIIIILNKLEEVLNPETARFKEEEKLFNTKQEIAQIWAIILPGMWW